MSLDDILWSIGLVAAKLSWVDPASFADMESNTRLLYITKLSGKSLDFYFLVKIHLNGDFVTFLRNTS